MKKKQDTHLKEGKVAKNKKIIYCKGRKRKKNFRRFLKITKPKRKKYLYVFCCITNRPTDKVSCILDALWKGVSSSAIYPQ